MLLGLEQTPLHRIDAYCWHYHLFPFYYTNVRTELYSDFVDNLDVRGFSMSGGADTCEFYGSVGMNGSYISPEEITYTSNSE